MSQRFATIPQLDPLRAIAALLVISQHYLPACRLGHFSYGWVGVDLFFVISGFLITGILLQQKERFPERLVLIRNFVIKRALRLFPAYYLVIGFFAILQVTTGFWSWNAGEWIWYFTYTSNFLFHFHGFGSGHLNHLWSLAVEEQFYLVWPWFVIFLSGPTLSRVLLVLVAIGLSVKIIYDPVTVRMLTSSHFDTLGCGALMAYHRMRHTKVWDHLRSYASIYAFAGAIGLALCMADFRTPVLETTSVLLFAVGMVACAVRGSGGAIGWVLGLPFLAFLGKISYGLYLYHKLLTGPSAIALSRWHIDLPGPVLLIILLTMTVSIAYASYRFVESPFLRLKERFDL